MIELISNSKAVAPGVRVPFQGIGGTAPYSYAVISGGGSIDGNGLYTAGAYGTVTVQVTDSLAATATLNIAVLNHMELVCDILQTYLGLANGRVYLFDQKINEPKDSNLFIVVQSLSCKPYSNSQQLDTSGPGIVGKQYTNFQNTLQIDVISKSIEALNRKEEVLMAFRSDYAESQQEINSFNIALLSTNFVNISQEDGAAIPYRFNIALNIQYCITNDVDIPYFDTFQGVGIITDPVTQPVNQTEIYWGRFPTFSSPSDAEIIALDGAGAGVGHEVADDFFKTYLGMSGNGQYLMWAWPTSFGEPTFTVNGLINTAFTKIRSNSPFTNELGFTRNYDVWITNTAQNSPIATIVVS